MEISHVKATEDAAPECTMNLKILSTEKCEDDFTGGSQLRREEEDEWSFT